MKTITLEIVREGPVSNQLVSSTTPYVALCENHPPVTFRLGFDHAEVLRWQRDLRYLRPRPTLPDGGIRHDSEGIERATAAMTSLLASIPSLSSELGSVTDPAWSEGGDQPLIHLRIVASALELAALPFECALAPAGYRGAGRSLVRALGVSMTRENQRTPICFHTWKDRPRVLLVSPEDDPVVPLRAHAAALYKALRPHVGWDEEIVRELGDYLTVRTRVTLDELATELGRGYTHVHILAHGARDEDEIGRREFKLHFRDRNGKSDLVGGARLAEALNPCAGTPPSTLTLAVCDAGAVGDVLLPAGSVAHQLHAAGFPLVVASQFPLTFAGSVVFTETFYERVLQGVDPRRALLCTRRALHTSCPASHDWASIVAFASIPPELERALEGGRENVAKSLAEVKLARVLRGRRGLSEVDLAALDGSGAASSATLELWREMNELDAEFDGASRAMREAPSGRERAHAARRVGSLCIRALDGLIRPRSGEHETDHDVVRGDRMRAAERAAEGARDMPMPLTRLSIDQLIETLGKAYEESYRLEGQYWAFLRARVSELLRGRGFTSDDWKIAFHLTEGARAREVLLRNPREEARAHAHLAELALLLDSPGLQGSGLVTRFHGEPEPRTSIDIARNHLQRVEDLVGTRSFQLYGTRCSLVRYALLLREHAPAVVGNAVALLAQLDDRGVPRDWKSRAM